MNSLLMITGMSFIIHILTLTKILKDIHTVAVSIKIYPANTQMYN